MIPSTAVLLSLAILNAAPDASGPVATKRSASSEILELVRGKRKFDPEDVPLVVRAMRRAGVENFVCSIDPSSGDVSISTDTKHVPHLDIKPGSCPNPIQIRGGAFATVATGVLGNAFDVTQVDLASVRLSRSAPTDFLTDPQVVPIHITFSDVGTPFDGTGCQCAALGPDGILDLSVQYNKQDLITLLKLDAEPNGSSVPLQVTGLSKNSETVFAATDCVLIQIR